MNKYEAGTRVRYIGNEVNKYAPSKGTLGTCMGGYDITINGLPVVIVKWDNGIKGNLPWACYVHDLEIVQEIVQKDSIFKVGQRVIYNSDYTDGIFYPPKGTQGTIKYVTENNKLLLVKWDEGVHGNHIWCCKSRVVKLLEE